MRILIIRHGDPDYEKDSLTQKGWHEAELLADKMEKTDVTAFYVSPLGRAQDTASVTLKRLGRSAKTYHWLREFHAPIYDKKTKKITLPKNVKIDFGGIAKGYTSSRIMQIYKKCGVTSGLVSL